MHLISHCGVTNVFYYQTQYPQAFEDGAGFRCVAGDVESGIIRVCPLIRPADFPALARPPDCKYSHTVTIRADADNPGDVITLFFSPATAKRNWFVVAFPAPFYRRSYRRPGTPAPAASPAGRDRSAVPHLLRLPCLWGLFTPGLVALPLPFAWFPPSAAPVLPQNSGMALFPPPSDGPVVPLSTITSSPSACESASLMGARSSPAISIPPLSRHVLLITKDSGAGGQGSEQMVRGEGGVEQEDEPNDEEVPDGDW
ncbi:hypothetical protein F5148DRAFT_1292086 [Russula earlei]|uniref:Uncharacterized protein n=1 Tax=Russula earlei TaxID=71964 RepID=A0ACC0TTQ0_9AGAM|nr:hypothetical protein F5148DRAFT_1292086 [Russula earlei]